jgi:hypothetical protein
MNAPKILPWLARKWNVSDARALELWRRACREAEAAAGNRCSPRFWGITQSRLLDLMDAEVLARYPATETPWITIQLNVLRFLATVRCWFMPLEHPLPDA